jgi:hypothetical protein
MNASTGLRIQRLFFTSGTAGRAGATNAQCGVLGEGASERPREDGGGKPSAEAKRVASAASPARTIAVKLLMLREPGRNCANELRKMLTPEARREFKFVSAGKPVSSSDATRRDCI